VGRVDLEGEPVGIARPYLVTRRLRNLSGEVGALRRWRPRGHRADEPARFGCSPVGDGQLHSVERQALGAFGASRLGAGPRRSLQVAVRRRSPFHRDEGPRGEELRVHPLLGYLLHARGPHQREGFRVTSEGDQSRSALELHRCARLIVDVAEPLQGRRRHSPASLEPRCSSSEGSLRGPGDTSLLEEGFEVSVTPDVKEEIHCREEWSEAGGGGLDQPPGLGLRDSGAPLSPHGADQGQPVVESRIVAEGRA